MRLCLGTAQLGMQYGIQNNKRPDRAEADQMISAALENGVSWFDTASAYGEAEEVLGHYILEHPSQANQMRIVSKLATDAFSSAPRKEWRDIALKHVKRTLKRLHRYRLDVYMIHNSSDIFKMETVEALDSVRREGLADIIGVSIYEPEEAMKALSYPQIGAIQIPYNIFDRRLDQCGFFEEARKKRVRVYARSSLLQGLVAMKTHELPAHMDFAAPYVERFQSLCERTSLSPLQAAIGVVWNHPDIQYLVFGADDERQLLEYIAITSESLPQSVLDVLNGAFGVVEKRVLNPSLWNQENRGHRALGD